MVLRAKKMALFDFDVTTCKTTQKWQKKGHFTTPVPVDPKFLPLLDRIDLSQIILWNLTEQAGFTGFFFAFSVSE